MPEVLLVQTRSEARRRYLEQSPSDPEFTDWVLEVLHSVSFQLEWNAVEGQLRRDCQYFLSRTSGRVRPEVVDEVLAEARKRAFEGYRTFRREAAFATWAVRIIRNSAKNFNKGRWREVPTSESTLTESLERSRRNHDIEDDPLVGIDLQDNPGMFRELLRDAASEGVVLPEIADALLAQLDEPELQQKDIAASLAVESNTLAVQMLRSRARLRTFIFTDRIALIGGVDNVRSALEVTQSRSEEPLTDFEVEVFTNIVLEQRSYRRVGWKGALMAATAKVGKYIDFEFI